MLIVLVQMYMYLYIHCTCLHKTSLLFPKQLIVHNLKWFNVKGDTKSINGTERNVCITTPCVMCMYCLLLSDNWIIQLTTHYTTQLMHKFVSESIHYTHTNSCWNIRKKKTVNIRKSFLTGVKFISVQSRILRYTIA